MNRILLQPDPDSALALEAAPSIEGPAGAAPLEIVACAPSSWDVQGAGAEGWPRVPGSAFLARDADGALVACGGFLPCDRCPRCKAGAHLACESPTRPGWNAAGGLADRVSAPTRHMAPVPGDDVDCATLAALLAAAGPSYQAIASAGACPGDTVVVFGAGGPGAIPLRMLAALGLRAIWVTPKAAPPLPDGIDVLTRCPEHRQLPTRRCHLIDIGPDRRSMEEWLPLVPHLLSCSLVGPGPLPPAPPLDLLLQGQVTLRWLRDLHPQLVLDLAGLLVSGRVEISDCVQRLTMGQFSSAFEELRRGAAARWPVLTHDRGSFVDSPDATTDNS